MFEFRAGYLNVDDIARRLSFADRTDDKGRHYFVMDRSEESPDEAVSDMANVYIERDDQCWGGFGGIQRVVLARNILTLHLDQRMVTQMGGHETIRIGFDVSDPVYLELLRVLALIMRGYEPRLVALAVVGCDGLTEQC